MTNRVVTIAVLLGAWFLTACPLPAVAAQWVDTSAFTVTWSRLDVPVWYGKVNRTWMYGPDYTGALAEAYAESPGGMRTVQYFDKTRMEITQPNEGTWSDPWYVTNGLLATELISGQMQIGDDTFQRRDPAEVNVAGDPDGMTGPTYATFAALLDRPFLDAGQLITQRVTRAGAIIDDPDFARYDARAGVFVPETRHRIAGPFEAFLWSTGPVMDWDTRVIVEEPLFENPFYATGFPITEAYWTRVQVAGDYQDVLVQCFERRCLTWTPSNPAGWQVEAGNVGQHYYRWRYGDWPQPPGELLYIQPHPFEGQCCAEVAGDIHLLAADGSSNTNLTDTPDGEAWPVWSPDGSRIAYVNRNQGFDVFVMNADGTNVVRLTDRTEPDYAPRWSPDGTRIVLTSERIVNEGSAAVATVNADGTGYRQLAEGRFPAWSPDGSMIAFDAGNRITVMDADGTNIRELVAGAGLQGTGWTPDGMWVTFFRNDDQYVYAIRPDGTGEHRLWDFPGTIVEWSPTGGRVAVFRDNDLYVMNADGSHPVNITNGYETLIVGPVWSPDGRYLAYYGGQWGSIRIASVEHPERPHRTIAHAPAPDYYLDWSPD